ncbi:MAG TPA: DUF6660 family protein [Anseongella sp.]
MKVVCYILTVYFLSLTGVPCADRAPSSFEPDHVSLSISNAGDSCGHNDAGDNCSTLCGCQCCQVHVLVVQQVALSPSETISADHINNILHFTNAVISPFLRPPIA